ncbi:response regulator transcription factor [Paenibacillus sp. WQ 127069]|uniref:Response regulator transcription factor n=1 Tax=Paenibacillus baimaensis TaxID=2982185 RepID=A0ABT2UG19_9BACL|nr:response regulator transcription factor [Paenibacillus sp. WQ 127069]MCU6793086.1 response regulator transcription factor [Paenibacillus sp. WQ 127069]
MKQILLIEDDTVISMVLKAYLDREGYSVRQAYSCREAISAFQSKTPELVLLDLGLPDGDGLTLLAYIRERSACPVIILTALSDLTHKLEGLNQGADDYISKPFIGEEVIARVNAVLRRSSHSFKQAEVQHYGSLRVNYKAHSVHLNEEELKFTPKDLDLLFYLLQHPNQTLSREQLIEGVWVYDYEGSDRAVDMAINRVRQALRNWNPLEGEIVTIRGMGYQARV